MPEFPLPFGSPTSRFRRGRMIDVEGLDALKAKVKTLMEMGQFDKASKVGTSMREVIAEATDMVAEQVKTNAQAVNLPKDAQKDIFAFHKARSNKDATMLAGVRRRGKQIGSGIQDTEAVKHGRYSWSGRGYREWNAGQSWEAGYRRGGKRVMKKGLRSRGKLIGESLATMWEKGTSRMRPHKFFQPAVTWGRFPVIAHISNGFKRILETL